MEVPGSRITKTALVILILSAVTGCAVTTPVEEDIELAAYVRELDDLSLDIFMEEVAKNTREGVQGKEGTNTNKSEQLTAQIADVHYHANVNQLIFKIVTQSQDIKITPTHQKRTTCNDPVSVAILNNSNAKFIYFIYSGNTKEGRIVVSGC